MANALEQDLIREYLTRSRKRRMAMSPQGLIDDALPEQQEPVGEIVMPPGPPGPIGPPAIDAPPNAPPSGRIGPPAIGDEPSGSTVSPQGAAWRGMGESVMDFAGNLGRGGPFTPLRMSRREEAAQQQPRIAPELAAYLRSKHAQPGDSPIPDDIPIGPPQPAPPPAAPLPTAPPTAPTAPAAPPKLGTEPDTEPSEPFNAEAPKPFDAEKHTPEADDDKRTKEINRLERWKGIAEGLGKLGQGLAGLRGHLPPDAFAAPDTSAIDRALERAEDLLSPEEEKMLAAAFPPGTFPKGLRRSTLRATLPSVAGFLESRERTKATANVAEAKANEKTVERGKKDEDLLMGEESKERGRIVTRVRALKQAKIAAENASNLIDTGSPQAIGAAMFSLSKAAGNIGAPSDRDIAIIEGQYGVPGLMNKIERGITGNFTENMKNAFKAIAVKAAENANSHLQEEQTAGLESFWAANEDRATRFGRSPEKYKQMFGPLYGAKDEVRMTRPDGTDVMVPAENAEKAKGPPFNYTLPGK
jgi:hypothetical protein